MLDVATALMDIPFIMFVANQKELTKTEKEKICLARDDEGNSLLHVAAKYDLDEGVLTVLFLNC